ncbi:MAG: hypothetical protein JWN06_392, partial [Propionibacteriaceae bacterium]|nr:hypothetical protein [Propionibacteriaceae bacterium]
MRPVTPINSSSSPPGLGGGTPLSVLRRVTAARPAPMVGERCEMCAEPIGEPHQHVVNLESRALMCTCRGCYLL